MGLTFFLNSGISAHWQLISGDTKSWNKFESWLKYVEKYISNLI